MPYDDVGHLASQGQPVIGQAPDKELAGRVIVGKLLGERRAEALYNGSANLFIEKQRVDYTAAIIDNPVLKHANQSSAGIHFDKGGMHPVAWKKRVFFPIETGS